MKKIFLILLVFLLAAVAIIGQTSWAQQENVISDENAAIILRKLKEISKDQAQILKDISEIKEELKIIKMRTTLN